MVQPHPVWEEAFIWTLLDRSSHMIAIYLHIPVACPRHNLKHLHNFFFFFC